MSSLRSRSPEALYHAIPQAPMASHPILQTEPDIEMEDEGDPDGAHESTHPHFTHVDARVRWIFFILGCAVLLPWNVMITATPYFMARLSTSPIRLTFSSYLSTSFTASNSIFLAHATATSKKNAPSRQIIVSILCLSVLTSLLTFSTFVHTTSGFFFAFVLLNGIAQAAFGSYLQTSCIAVASLFGPTAVQPMMSGQAGVAVVVSGVQVLSALASVRGDSEAKVSSIPTGGHGEAEERSAFVFFGLSTLFLLASAGAQVWLTNMPVYKTVAGSLEARAKTDADEIDGEEAQGLVSRGRQDASEEKGKIFRIAKANMIYEVAVAYVFVVTLAVFPPITTSVAPTNPSMHPLLFSSIHFFVFGVGDFCGRYVCSFPRLLTWSPKRLLALSLARTLFVPLFLMCNVQRPSSSAYTPIINSDFIFMLILFLFALSNGYVSSMCMMSAPSLEHNHRLKSRADIDVAATVANFCLILGLAAGSIMSFAVRGAVCHCNPFTS
ncbi:nucleoside transporter-domain-containing protein [Desarmillaria tabescens]|uniref:Nucleoside transporter-domain-containing protein n=1 Tax=Armillaria tabescens TaxID=1929756 RepID=A0AA39U046_ARMTA|nr:nucleoside transporter-domain-containing protein [Desarmillaria tabescens]KAK0467879.1 nucleoside transporter-domain-containing protein [Desarmillaria tabescens]